MPRGVLALLTLLSLVALAAAGANYVLPHPQVWLGNASWTLSATIAVCGVARAGRRSTPENRRGWRLLLVACTAWAAGQLTWDVYSTSSFPASPNLGDACWLAFAVAGAIGILRLGHDADRSRAMSWLELGPIIVAACALLTALLWDPVATSRLSALGQVTALAYPVLYVSAALVMVQLVVAGALDVTTNRGLRVVLAGMVLEAIAFILWSPTLLGATYVVGANPIDALWTVGMSLIGLGAWTAGPVGPAADRDSSDRDRGGLLPGATFATLAVVQGALILTGAADGAIFALCVGLAVVGGSLMARGHVLRTAQASLYSRVRQRERELQVLNDRLGEESRRDPLTGLGNRLRLSEDLIEIDARAQRYEHGYCFVLCDLDRFKAYNDFRGHQAGDDVLRQVARLLERNARAGDRLYRYGGEELLIVLPAQDEAAGRQAAEHHRRALEEAALPHPLNTPDVVTMSAGVAAAGLFETPEEVLRRADAALYEAKSSGRNRVCIADPATI